ncbi:Retrovirus-related Pol polyprotein from transposon TNT 1-94 [Gossypium australe]|uniref:Retrovirus-related Pol polyprotein from transposon TNT 1-94 n=1 Tax=Gossypium australe TaxID=47621 RepID=A0A5B6W8G9_9ROSI|nr:Retrovirus-related Pol polyprotein from transposon TNT 1-94 [Gossypium australe]
MALNKAHDNGLILFLFSFYHLVFINFSESTLFTKGSCKYFVALLIYVNDIILVGKDFSLLTIVRASSTIFYAKRSWFFKRHKNLQLLEYTRLLRAKPMDLPMVPSFKLSKDIGDPLPNPTRYMRLVGWLLYLTNTRPDITFVVYYLSQFVSDPYTYHHKVVYNLLAYLKQCNI